MIKTLPSANFTSVTWRKSSSLLEVSSPVRRHVHLVMLVSYWVLNLTSIKTTKIVTHPHFKANENERMISYHVATPRSEHYGFPMKKFKRIKKMPTSRFFVFRTKQILIGGAHLTSRFHLGNTLLRPQISCNSTRLHLPK
jgi:hypothetical protein